MAAGRGTGGGLLPLGQAGGIGPASRRFAVGRVSGAFGVRPWGKGLRPSPFVSGTGRPGATAATGAGALGAGGLPGLGPFGRAERGTAARNGVFTQPGL